MESSYSGILNLWFGGTLNENYSKWFTKGENQKRLDDEITIGFSDLLHKAENHQLNDWLNNPDSTVALIVLLDQFSRHIYRNSNRDQIKINDAIALEISRKFISVGWYKSVSTAMHIFSLMPFRHSNKEENIQFVLKQIEECENMHVDDTRLIERFKKTALRKLYDLPLLNMVDQNTEILAFYPFDADESDISRHKLTRCMNEFLKEKWQTNYQYTIISLSGGVDSMCILKCLLVLAPVYQYKIIAIHIDYANRPESGMEADFVEKWCEKYNVIFRKRTITEVTRNITDRELYEKESRRIRFEFYQTVINEFKAEAGICFGHHKGDEQENIITNIMKGRESILNLSGMSSESMISGVKVWRPFMPYPKSVIYEFSHKYGIPYFLDTTPKWSNRGKVRNELQPTLSDIFGEGYLKNLSALGEDSSDLNILLDELLFRPYWNSIQRSEVAVWLNLKDHREKPKLFWKETMRYLLYSMGLTTVRDKSMGHFMRRLRDGYQQEPVWVSLKKENFSMLFEDELVLFRIIFFPQISHFTNTTIIEVDKTYQLGLWLVSITRVPLKEFDDNDLSLWEIIRHGEVTYYIEESDTFHINSDARPKAFRLYPKQITLSMPLVVGKNWTVGSPITCIKVKLKFTGNELAGELERLKQRSDEKKLYGKSLKPKKQKITQNIEYNYSAPRDNDNDNDQEDNQSLFNFLNE